MRPIEPGCRALCRANHMTSIVIVVRPADRMQIMILEALSGRTEREIEHA